MQNPDQPTHVHKVRDSWSSHLGIVLAVAGSAIGLGNFLRFPAKAVANGGGAFMIPYFISLLLLGIPLMWIEWTLGRHGGSLGCGTAPGIFHNLCPRSRLMKYFGVLGILGPLIIFIYYTYIESWTLGYSFFALMGKYTNLTDFDSMKSFLKGYQGLEHNQFFNGIGPAYIFFLITFLINIFVIYFGIRKGIERLCNIAMPVLFFCGIVLLIRVVTLAPNISHPDWNVSNGFGYMWNPDFSKLQSGRVWVEAAGQIFFTLSVGIGVILTYASYLSKKDDVALTGLTAVSTNELAEVILGGSIVIPAAFIFFGPEQLKAIVAGGIFDLGFVSMPLVLNQLPLANILGFIWFLLLFLAGVTSSVSLAQPFVAFLEEELGLTKKQAVAVIGVTAFILCHPPILFLKNGVVDEMDFWGGSVFLIVFATVEVILFGWIMGIDRGWQELQMSAAIKIPEFFKFIIKYITPAYLLTILGVWLWQDWLSIILMKSVAEENKIYILATRIGIVVLFFILSFVLRWAWRTRQKQTDNL